MSGIEAASGIEEQGGGTLEAKVDPVPLPYQPRAEERALEVIGIIGARGESQLDVLKPGVSELRAVRLLLREVTGGY